MNDQDQTGAASGDADYLQRISGLGWRPPKPAELAALIPDYEVAELRHAGKNSAVYKARQVSLDRSVAIKVLPPEKSRDFEFAERFRREAKTMARLKHGNIVALYSFGKTSQGHLYLVTEYVEGATLHEFIHTGVLKPKLALAIVGQLCEALACAHREGIIHRDVKPANIVVDVKGNAKIADFGLARSSNPNAGPSLTMRGVVIGTPDYMAPERLRGEKVDQRADIYSLGVVLYEALTQKIPQGTYEPASRKSGLPARVDEIIARALQKEPAQRFQSTMEMKIALDSVFDPTAAPLASPAQQPKPIAPNVQAAPGARKSWRWPAIAAAAVVFAAGCFALLRPKSEEVVVREKPRGSGTAKTTARPVGAASMPDGIDVLAAVDFTRDSTAPARASAWKRKAEGVIGSHRARTTVAWPVEPSGDYEWNSRVTRSCGDGEDVQWFIPAGRANWFILVSHSDELAFVPRGDRVSIRPNPIGIDGPHDVKIRVVGAHDAAPRCEVLVDGKLVASGAGAVPTYSKEWDLLPANRPGLGIFMPHDGQLVLHSVMFRPLSGDKILPANSPAARAAAPTSSHTVSAKAPEQEMKLGTSRYRLVRASIPWTQAKTEAELQGGHLATLTTKEEDEWARKTFGGELRKWSRIWIGAIQLDRDQPWQWVTDEPFEFSHWIPGEPNGTRTPGMQPPYCASISNSLDTPGSNGWDDTAPSGGPAVLGYLIEWDEPAPKPVAAAPAPAATPVPAAATPTPTPAATPAPMPIAVATPKPTGNEAEQRLTAIQAQFDAAYTRDVGTTFDAALDELRTRYQSAVDQEIARLTQAGKTSEVVALREERARVSRGASLGDTADAGLPDSLKNLRQMYRVGAAKIAKDRDAKVKPLREWQLRQLDALFTDLSKAQKTDLAQTVKQRRDALATEWTTQLSQAAAAAAVATAVITTPSRPGGLGESASTSSWRRAAQLALNFGGKLDIRVDGKRSTINVEAELPSKRFEVLKIDLSDAAKNEKLTDADLAPLASCRDLEELKIDRANVTSAGLEGLRGIQTLKALRVNHCPKVNDQFMGVVATLINLNALELVHDGITKEGQKQLSRCTKLHRLTLHGRGCSAAGFGAMANVPLEELSVAELADANSIDLSPLRHLKNVSFISMPSARAKLIEQAQRLKDLETLRFTGCDFTDDDLAKLAGLGFSALEVEGGTVRGAGLSSLRSCRGLTRLRLANCNIADTTIEAIGRDLASLHILTLSGTGQVQPAALKPLSKLRNLKELTLADGIGNDANAVEVATLPGVQKLNLSGCPQLSSAGLQSLTKLKALKVLIAKNCSKLTPADLESFRKSRPDVTLEL